MCCKPKEGTTCNTCHIELVVYEAGATDQGDLASETNCATHAQQWIGLAPWANSEVAEVE